MGLGESVEMTLGEQKQLELDLGSSDPTVRLIAIRSYIDVCIDFWRAKRDGAARDKDDELYELARTSADIFLSIKETVFNGRVPIKQPYTYLYRLKGYEMLRSDTVEASSEEEAMFKAREELDEKYPEWPQDDVYLLSVQLVERPRRKAKA
jgi:hypothetical protein